MATYARFNPAQVIARKRDGHELTADEIAAFVKGFVRGDIPDYQMAALAMAIYLRGMVSEEIVALTTQMVQSGVTLPWTAGGRPNVDKHSTGGVGDKTSLVLAPLLACCGLQVPMISGRGLGATGGTLDKLAAIPGFRTDLNLAQVREITERVGCVISGATPEIAPADRKLYALRDVTATVASTALITASIMSKKLAENLSALVLDVKFGSGAFMKSLDLARDLARSLVRVGSQLGLRTCALLTDMNQPLGRMIGNAVEVDEAVDTLRGGGPADLVQLVLELGAELLWMEKVVPSREEGHVLLGQHIDSGRALAKFAEMVSAQGGDLDAPRRISPATEMLASRGGIVTEIQNEQLGLSIILLGGGRRVMSDTIDASVGLEMLVRIGDTVQAGQPLLRIFADRSSADSVRPMLSAAIRIGDTSPAPLPLIAERVMPS